MKAQDIHGMTNDELQVKLAELKDELFNLRFRHAVNELEILTLLIPRRKTSRESKRKYAPEKLRRTFNAEERRWKEI